MRSSGHLEQRVLTLVTLGLVAFGLVMVYSATSAAAALGDGNPMEYLQRQAVYAVLGVTLMAAASRVDYHRLRYLAPPLLVAALGLCAAVLVVAPEINGARRWFLLGPASFQPSELSKLALCLFAAAYLARRRAPRTVGELVKPLGLLTLLLSGLILLEPDLGTTITLFGMVLAILLVAGTSLRLLALVSAFALVAAAAAIWAEPYRRARFFSFLDRENDKELCWDVSLKAIYAYSEALSFQAGWSHLFVEDGLSQGSFNIGNGLTFEGGIDDDDADYFYFDTKLKF